MRMRKKEERRSDDDDSELDEALNVHQRYDHTRTLPHIGAWYGSFTISQPLPSRLGSNEGTDTSTSLPPQITYLPPITSLNPLPHLVLPAELHLAYARFAASPYLSPCVSIPGLVPSSIKYPLIHFPLSSPPAHSAPLTNPLSLSLSLSPMLRTSSSGT
jgi:hypothetical protein